MSILTHIRPGPGRTGFRIREVMAGTHEFVSRRGPPGEFPFSFELEWGNDSLREFLNPLGRERFLIAPSRGVIRIGQLVEETPCEGTLELRYFDEAKIRYRMTFAVEDNRYEYIGEKVGIRPWNLHRTHTTCYGVVYDLEDGKEISRSLVRFGLDTLPAFLSSFHLTRS